MQAYVGFELFEILSRIILSTPPTSLRGDCACAMTVMSASMLSSCGDSWAGGSLTRSRGVGAGRSLYRGVWFTTVLLNTRS